jgi:hypothetical protein
MSWLKKTWNKILYLGCSDNDSLAISQRIRFTNQLAFLLLTVSILFMVKYALDYDWRRVYLTLTLPAVALVIFFLNYFKLSTYSRLLLSLAFGINVLIMTLLVKISHPELVTVVNYSGPRFLIISSAVFPLLLFSSKEYPVAWICTIFIVFIGNWGFDIIHEALHISPKHLHVEVRNFKIVYEDSLIITIVLLTAMGTYRSIAYEYEKYNQKILNEIKATNDSLKNREEELKETILAVEQSNEFEKIRNWEGVGLAALQKLIRNNYESDNLYTQILTFVVQYIGGQQGAIFVLTENEDNVQYLALEAVYAWDTQRYQRNKTILIGEGLLGQCAKNGRPKYVTRIPKDYTYIPAGVNTLSPKEMLILPLHFHRKLYGVLEINSIQEISTYKMEFLERSSEIIASTIANIQNATFTQQVLQEAQQLASELTEQDIEIQRIKNEWQNKEIEYIAKIEQLEKQFNNKNFN